MPRPKSKRSGEERPYNIGDKVLSVENGMFVLISNSHK